MADGSCGVLIVGGGAAGVLAAATLARADVGEVVLVERRQSVGPGFAYSTRDPLHLLNNYAGRMSALHDDPDHLVRWCHASGMDDVDPGTFVSRVTYGRYLGQLAESLPATRRHDEVVDLRPVAAGYDVRLGGGSHLHARVVLVAVGSPPSRPVLPGAADPWSPLLSSRASHARRLLLLGTGLTAVDVAVRLAEDHPDLEIDAASRHGLLPARHCVAAPPLPEEYDGPGHLRGVLAEVTRSLRAGRDWRLLVESLKASADRLWAGWSPVERAAFLSHAARTWEVHRHRIAPEMGRRIDALLDSGRLRVRGTAGVDPTRYDLVVNCTGPGPVPTGGWNPLVDELVSRGLARRGPLGLGLEAMAPGLHLLGAVRRGTEWEVGAVPDLRRQAIAITRQITRTDERELAVR